VAISKPKNIAVSKLDFDLENYRLDVPANDQSDALRLIMDKHGDTVLGLARHIARHGSLNPAESLIVIQDGTRYTVLEGNRRLAALRLLQNSKLAPADKQVAFARAAKGFVRIPSISCVIADSREEAYVWIQLKHSGQGSGEGAVRWGANGVRNFATRSQGKVTYVQGIIHMLQTLYSDDVDLQAMIDVVRHGDQLTNLERILQDTAVRQRLGIVWNSTYVSLEYSAATLAPFFQRLFTLLTTERPNGSASWSRAWATAKERKTWLADQSDVLPPVDDALDEPIVIAPPAQDGKSDGPQGKADKPKPGSNGSRSRKPSAKKLDTEGMRAHEDYPLPVRKLFDEIRDIDYENFPYLTLDGMRTLIEKTIKSYARLQGDRVMGKRRGQPDPEAFAQFGDCIAWMDDHCSAHPGIRHHKTTLSRLRNQSGKWPASAELFNGSNHNDVLTIDAALVKASWELMHPLLQDLLKRGSDAPAD